MRPVELLLKWYLEYQKTFSYSSRGIYITIVN